MREFACTCPGDRLLTRFDDLISISELTLGFEFGDPFAAVFLDLGVRH
jgi:hypothetical protein